MLNKYRTFVHAGTTGSTRPERLLGNYVAHHIQAVHLVAISIRQQHASLISHIVA